MTNLSILADSAMHRFWFREPANSALGRDTDALYMFILWVCIFSFALVMGLMVYFVIRYRAKPGVPTQRSPSHNTPLELAWSVVPLLVMVVIFFWGFKGYVNKLVAPADAYEIRITGQQWNWAVVYANGREPSEFKLIGNRESPVIPVPAGRPVKLIFSSNDVLHAFYIPAMRMKIDVFPNRFTSFWFQAERAGEMHEVFCAEYCGMDHSEMAAWIKVVEPEEFEKFLNTEIVIEDPVEYGEYLFKAKGCRACHSIDGSPNTGPTWQGIFGRAVSFTDGSSLSAQEMSDPVKFADYIRESIFDPRARIVTGYQPQMNSYVGLINPKQLDAIIAFMKSPKLNPGAK